ncbi:MAG: DUF3617 family protein [Methyloglobulus sp.]|nr:hypothetical protein [Methyloglobulus sp.]
MKTFTIGQMMLFAIFSYPAYAETLAIEPGLWALEHQSASNLKGARQRSCITEDSISNPVRSNMILSCTGKLSASSTRTSAEWELICPDGKNQKLQVKALSPKLLEVSSTPLGHTNVARKKAYKVKSIAKWISADCGNAPIFPASR